MNNPRLAGRYAKSLLDLAVEQNKLDAVYADIRLLQSIAKSNPDLTRLLGSPVVGAEKKGKIIEAVLGGKVSPLTGSFLQLLIRKTRESNLNEIVKAFLEQYNELKEIHNVKLTTAETISPELQSQIVQKIKADTGVENIELEALVDAELIGGFKLEMRGNLVDTSILRELKDVRRQFADNIYLQKLR